MAAPLDPSERFVRSAPLPRQIVGAWFLACFFLIACDPYADTRAELGEADAKRFDRGLRAATPCWSCHDPRGDAFKIGPPLSTLFGRKAGSVKGFPYSAAMLDSSVVWNAGSLDRFLENPQAVVPYNRMLSAPVADPRVRADLIFFFSVRDRHSERILSR